MRVRGFEVVKGYEDKKINLPKRETKHSAGYDIEAADDYVIPSVWRLYAKSLEIFATNEIQFGDHSIGPRVETDVNPKLKNVFKPVLVKTGIKAYMNHGEALFLYSRSSNPLKRLLVLANGVGVIDSDYYENEDNDGHIMFQFLNYGVEDVVIKKGERIGQGIFKRYLHADKDLATGKRMGGFGSTDGKSTEG